jgi:hypothetical protein
MSIEDRLNQEKNILKKLNREILKCAKNNDTHYYWNTLGLNQSMIKSIIATLEKEGKIVKSKGTDFKIIRW